MKLLERVERARPQTLIHIRSKIIDTGTRIDTLFNKSGDVEIVTNGNSSWISGEIGGCQISRRAMDLSLSTLEDFGRYTSQKFEIGVREIETINIGRGILRSDLGKYLQGEGDRMFMEPKYFDVAREKLGISL